MKIQNALPVGDKFFWSDDKWNCQSVIGLRYDHQVNIRLFYQWDIGVGGSLRELDS